MMTSISSINTNAPAMQYQSQLTRSIDKQNTSMERLSSGLKINTAKDDAAGLQISNRLQVQSRGMDVAIRNANDGISVLQTAEGAMGEYTNGLMSMRDLTLRYVNGSLNSEDRKAISSEFGALRNELNRIAQTTSFGGDKLLNGSNSSRSFQIGDSSGQAIRVTLPNLNAIGQSTSESKEVYWKLIKEEYRDDWESLPNTVWTFHYHGSNGKYEVLEYRSEEGDSLQDTVNGINSELGDKIKVFLYVDDDPRKVAHHTGKKDGLTFNMYGVSDGAYVTGPGVSKEGEQGHKNAPNYPFRNVGNYSIRDIEDNSNVFYTLPSLIDESNANQVLEQLDELLQYIDSSRASLGASQNRLTHAINNLSQSSENVANSHSQIRDTDFAKESTQLTKQSILREVNTSMLAQAGNAPKSALNLLS
ncbi:flagellin [Vibrio parahaemolyticus]|uniref:flagellin N-terminal helical domain-containing protein n=5 Tax=Vibrio parahaemolyticus TaxID=670 RepID=UPI0003E23DD4|nr:flagellin [Vibrio parahaemolyticus]ETT17474.1 flagellin D [Vibrio parahaemolyticus 50]MDG3024061.1 flagellin [Vibrio parahaemolyticus]